MPEILRHVIVSSLRRLSGHIGHFTGLLVRVTGTGRFFFNLFFKKLEEMDEDFEKCVIETLSVVSSVRFHTGDKTHKEGFYPPC